MCSATMSSWRALRRFGRWTTSTDSGHAYGIRTDDAAEVLVRVGLDPVALRGEVLTVFVAGGQRVERGQPLAEVYLELLRRSEQDPTTVLVVTSTDALCGVVPVVAGTVAAGGTVVEIHQ